jgi:hypothetical protein
MCHLREICKWKLTAALRYFLQVLKYGARSEQQEGQRQRKQFLSPRVELLGGSAACITG